MKTPLLLIISGTSGVGKSTLSHKLLKVWKTPIILETFDLIREALRGYDNEHNIFYRDDSCNINVVDKKILNSSSYDLKLNDFFHQCELLLPALKNICIRLTNTNIPAIIEGVNLDPVTILSSKISKNYFSSRENTVFINLHISNKILYSQQLNLRLKQRKIININKNYFEKIITRSKDMYDRLEKFICDNPQYNNIYNIDLSQKNLMKANTSHIISEVISIIYNSRDATFNGSDFFHTSKN